MKKQFLRLPENMSAQARSAFLIATLLVVVHFIAAAYYLYLIQTTGIAQFYAPAIVSFVLGILLGIGAMLSRRGQSTQGMILILGAVAVSYPPLATLVGELGLVLGFALMIAGPMIAFRVLPRKSDWVMTIVTVISGLAAILLDVFGSTARPSLPGIVIQLLAASVVGVLGFFIVRQTWGGNLRTKLLVAFIGIVIFSVGIVAFSAQRSLSTSLTEDIGNNLAEQASSRGIEIATTIDREKDILHALSLSLSIQKAARAANETSKLSQADIDRLDQQWRAADAANNNADPLVSGVLNNEISDQLRSFRGQFEQHVEVFLTGTQGISIASTNRTSDYNQADEEWWQTAYRDGVYIGQPEYDDSSKTIAMNMAVAVRENGDGDIVGVLRTTVDFSTFANTLAAGTFGQTGRSVILLPSGQELRLNAVGDGTFELIQEETLPELAALSQSGSKYQNVSLNGTPTLAGIGSVTPPGDTDEDTQVVSNLGWRVATMQDKAEALQPVTTQTRNALIVGFIIMLAAIIAAIGLARVISNPIIHLNTVAQKIAAGDIAAQAEVETRDEIGTLATTFNSMTARLREFIATLEERVAERTHSLELAAEVGRSVSQVRSLDVMLKDAAELIRSRFDLYYTQVYLTNQAQNSLLLQSGTGTVGAELTARGHRLPINTNSINGRAVVEKQPVIISDTSASASFRPNPLLPETRSEMAVPLMVGEKVVGVLDLQSQIPGSLNVDLLTAFEALAGQLAIAIQNANLLAETEQARAEVEKQAKRLTRANWQEYLDAIHKPEEVGFVFEQNKIAPLSGQEVSSNENALTAPIAVTGEALGNLVVEMEGQSPISRTSELVNTVARQVAQQIESLRLLDSAERYRAEAEAASRRLTREGWKDYTDANVDKGLSYIYDLKEVRTYNQIEDQQAEESAFSLPLKVRDETVGRLVVQGLGADDTESLELASAVAERLSAHIEGLRQFDQTQSALAQSEKLFEASRILSQAQDLQELTASTVKMLDIPEINRAVLATFNYDTEGNVNSLDIIANWWNGTGHEITPVGTHYPLEVIRVMPMFVSPTPVFFNDTSTDKRVDATTMQLVQRLNLRAVAVLPLFSGTRQIGGLILEAEEPHTFTTEETRLFASLAPQIATMLENRRQFERAQKQAERESMLNTISQKIQSATSVEAVLQIAARELGHALGAPLTIAQLGVKDGK